MSHRALGQQFFHVTPATLKPGDELRPYSELHPDGPPKFHHEKPEWAWRADRVWMSGERRQDLEKSGWNSYVVEPADDVVEHTDRDPVLDKGPLAQYHASSAKVVRRLPRANDMAQVMQREFG